MFSWIRKEDVVDRRHPSAHPFKENHPLPPTPTHYLTPHSVWRGKGSGKDYASSKLCSVRTTDGAKQGKKLREKSRGCTAEVLMTEGYIYAFTKKHTIHAESIGWCRCSEWWTVVCVLSTYVCVPVCWMCYVDKKWAQTVVHLGCPAS